MPDEYVTIRARVESDPDGRASLALDDRRCAGCIGCFGRTRPSPALCELSGIQEMPLGTSVECRWPVRAVTLASLTLYGLPLAAILVGASLGALVAGPGDLAAVAGALVGLATGALVTVPLRRRLELELGRCLEVSDVENTHSL